MRRWSCKFNILAQLPAACRWNVDGSALRRPARAHSRIQVRIGIALTFAGGGFDGSRGFHSGKFGDFEADDRTLARRALHQKRKLATVEHFHSFVHVLEADTGLQDFVAPFIGDAHPVVFNFDREAALAPVRAQRDRAPDLLLDKSGQRKYSIPFASTRRQA